MLRFEQITDAPAEPYSTLTLTFEQRSRSRLKVELDNENGALVYSVELSNGMDVKVDAGNAAVLYTDSDVDNEGIESEGLSTEG